MTEEGKKENFTKIPGLSSENWESGRKVSEASYLKRKDGTEALSFRMGTKSDKRRPMWGKTIWIDEELDLPSWLNWFIKTLKSGYLKLFGKKVDGFDNQEEFYKAKIEQLNKQLVEAQIRLEETQIRNEEDKKLIELAKEVQKSIEDYNKTFNELKELLNTSKAEDKGKEEAIKQKLKENPWLLGLECAVQAKNQNIDNQTQIDLHVKTKFDQDRIFELKSPNLKLFKRKSNDETRRLSVSSELSDGLSELIIYLERTNIYSDRSGEGTYGIVKPSGYILMGFELDEEEKKLLAWLNFHLSPHIQIVTYDQLQNNIKRELELIGNLNLGDKNAIA